MPKRVRHDSFGIIFIAIFLFNIFMRIWDVTPQDLCRKHLLGEHRELHALWAILTNNKKGYRFHPETKRWVGKLAALYARHDQLVLEMKKRKYHHLSPLDKKLAVGKTNQNTFVNTITEQNTILNQKNCPCYRDH